MVRIPNIKIPSVRVGRIGPTSNIGNGGATPAPPTPITCLTQWEIVGNSEVHGQEIWSCGEYSAVDSKYHILVQPLGGNIADIALDEPLRQVNNVADTIEYANGMAVVTRQLWSINLGSINYTQITTNTEGYYRFRYRFSENKPKSGTKTLLSAKYGLGSVSTVDNEVGQNISANQDLYIYDAIYNQNGDSTNLRNSLFGIDLLYALDIPVTETIEAPQIQEAESYTCVISQGGKAVSWSSFETDSE